MKALTPATSPKLERLRTRVNRYRKSSKARNTIIAYNRAWADFEDFCVKTLHTVAMPAGADIVSAYVAHLADVGAKVATIEQRIAAIASAHKDAKHDDPTALQLVCETMAGIRRELGVAPTQKAPLIRDDIRHVALLLGDDVAGLRDRAVILLGFAGAFRESELADLNVEDLQFTETALFVRVRKSKTDQEKKGRIKQIPLLSEANALFCPVTAVSAYVAAAELASGPLFRKIDRWGKVWDKRIRPAAIAFIVKRAVANAGYDKAEFAGHSLRAGFVTQADMDDVPLHEIQEVTWHKSSDMVRRYIRRQGISGSRTIKTVLGE